MPRHGAGRRGPEFNKRSTKDPWRWTDQETRQFTFPDSAPYTQTYRDANDYSRRSPIMDENPPSPRNKKKRTPQGYDNLP